MLRGKTSNIRNAFLLLICNFLKKLKTKSNHFLAHLLIYEIQITTNLYDKGIII